MIPVGYQAHGTTSPALLRGGGRRTQMSGQAAARPASVRSETFVSVCRDIFTVELKSSQLESITPFEGFSVDLGFSQSGASGGGNTLFIQWELRSRGAIDA
jgi:hypothetical protein